MPDTIKPDLDGNELQIMQIAEQIAESAVRKFALNHPEISHVKAEIPAPLKWAAAIISGLFTVGIAGVAFWLVTSVSSVQVTLARMDERQIQQSSNQEAWKADVIRRLGKLEDVAGGPKNAP